MTPRQTEQKNINTALVYGVVVAAVCFVMAIINLISTAVNYQVGFMGVVRGIFSGLISNAIYALPAFVCFNTAKNNENKEERLKVYNTAKIIAIVFAGIAALSLIRSVVTVATNFTTQTLGLFIISLGVFVLKAVACFMVVGVGKAAAEEKKIDFTWYYVVTIIFAVSCSIGYFISAGVLSSVISAVLFLALFWGGIGGLKKLNWKVIKGAVIGAVVAGDVGAVVGAAAAQAKENGGSASAVVKNAVKGAVIAGDAGAVIGAATTKNENKK